MTGSGLIRRALVMAVCSMTVSDAAAITRYNVRLNTTVRAGQRAQFAFDVTSGTSGADSLEILDFAHNGKTGSFATLGVSYFEGGPVRGHLLAGVNPAPRTIIGTDFFYNHLSVPFDSLGTSVTFALQLPEPSPAPSGMPDEMAFFYLTDSAMTAFNTADPLGNNALFAICVTGAAGGDLSVFTPMMFIPPDTLALDLTLVGVPDVNVQSGRLQFRSVAPNPAAGGVRLVYEVPAPGGALRIIVFDIAGRIVAEPFTGKRTAGVWATQWNATNRSGRLVAPGIYLVQLQMAGQSLVRRVVLTR